MSVLLSLKWNKLFLVQFVVFKMQVTDFHKYIPQPPQVSLYANASASWIVGGAVANKILSDRK